MPEDEIDLNDLDFGQAEGEAEPEPEVVPAPDYSARLQAAESALTMLGLGLDEAGQVAVQNPDALRAFMQPQVAAQEPAPVAAATPAEDVIPDPAWDPEGYKAYFQKQVKAAAAEEVAGLKTQMRELIGLVSAREEPAAVNTAKEYLTSQGFEQVANDPEFETMFKASIATLPLNMRNNPDVLRAAGFQIIPALQAKRGFTRQQEAPVQNTRRQMVPPPPSRGAAALTQTRTDTEDEISLDFQRVTGIPANMFHRLAQDNSEEEQNAMFDRYEQAAARKRAGVGR